MFNFEIENTENTARTGTLKTPHGEIPTPIFMPVGTKASVKTLSNHELREINSKIILANTYHLYLRPGNKLIKEMGGLHKWMNWDKPILTDSGGFQVFSLAKKTRPIKNQSIQATVKITEEGVEFKSHLDGSKHFFTPEYAMQIQADLGADIIMAFDECADADSSKEYFKKAMIRTHNWAIRSKNEHEKLNKEKLQALFPIVQGGIFKDLRIESAKFINELDCPGNAIGGLSVGESKEIMYEMIETIIPYLSDLKPRYLMGVGTPEDIFEAIERGIDMFDCVHPTRMARHGAFWDNFGRHTIKNEKFKKDENPLMASCRCYACQNHSKSYIRHLFMENEILAQRLMSIHNLHFLIELTQKIREEILNNNFKNFKKDFFNNFQI
jgi:queuine tRNA-ribosyltransferase